MTALRSRDTAPEPEVGFNRSIGALCFRCPVREGLSEGCFDALFGVENSHLPILLKSSLYGPGKDFPPLGGSLSGVQEGEGKGVLICGRAGADVLFCLSLITD